MARGQPRQRIGEGVADDQRGECRQKADHHGVIEHPRVQRLQQIREVRKRVSVPIFCIGGIKLENLKQVLAAGAKSVVIVSGLLRANDIVGYTRACKKLVTDLRPVISGP